MTPSSPLPGGKSTSTPPLKPRVGLLTLSAFTPIEPRKRRSRPIWPKPPLVSLSSSPPARTKRVKVGRPFIYLATLQGLSTISQGSEQLNLNMCMEHIKCGFIPCIFLSEKKAYLSTIAFYLWIWPKEIYKIIFFEDSDLYIEVIGIKLHLICSILMFRFSFYSLGAEILGFVIMQLTWNSL